MQTYIMALDQGTTSSRCILFEKSGKIHFMSQKKEKLFIRIQIKQISMLRTQWMRQSMIISVQKHRVSRMNWIQAMGEL